MNNTRFYQHKLVSNWLIRFAYVLIVIISTSSFADENDKPKQNEASNVPQEWVVVLRDPRPARLQGWNSNRYRNQASYNTSDFKRIGTKFAKKNGLKLKQEWFIETLAVYCLIVEFTGDTESTLNALEKNDSVEWVQKSNDFKLLSAENITIDKDMPVTQKDRKHMNYNGQGTVIAIIDSGVDKLHQDLSHAIKNTSDFVITNSQTTGNKSIAENHGTAIAGVLIAQPNNKLGLSGVAPAAQLLAFRGCWEEASKATHCNTLSLARALDAVIKIQPDILNLSLSGPYDPLLNRLIDMVIKNRTIIVAAFDPVRSNKERFPSPREGILIVRAENLNPEFTNTFTAPGSQIVPTPNDNYSFQTGHSIASAHTSGVLALLTEARNNNPKIQSIIDQAFNGEFKSSDLLLNHLQH